MINEKKTDVLHSIWCKKFRGKINFQRLTWTGCSFECFSWNSTFLVRMDKSVGFHVNSMPSLNSIRFLPNLKSKPQSKSNIFTFIANSEYTSETLECQNTKPKYHEIMADSHYLLYTWNHHERHYLQKEVVRNKYLYVNLRISSTIEIRE